MGIRVTALRQPLVQGRLRVSQAKGPPDLARAQELRHLAFRSGSPAGRDSDPYDDSADHVLVTDARNDRLLCCFRVQAFTGATIADSYGAQFYDLSRLSGFAGPMLEMGRFCLHPDCHDPDVLRLAWAAVARMVDAQGVTLLFGCSSFPGADPARHAAALAGLAARVAPPQWAPGRRARDVVALRDQGASGDPRAALAATPALLRSYLGMGAWVSDHAVIDHQLDTLHVLTGLEIARIPAARARALRAIGCESMG